MGGDMSAVFCESALATLARVPGVGEEGGRDVVVDGDEERDRDGEREPEGGEGLEDGDTAVFAWLHGFDFERLFPFVVRISFVATSDPRTSSLTSYSSELAHVQLPVPCPPHPLNVPTAYVPPQSINPKPAVPEATLRKTSRVPGLGQGLGLG